jgi:hypothetical protein
VNIKKRKKLVGSQKRFYVVANVTISVGTEVMASTEAEARALACERGFQSLCHQCASADDERREVWCTSGELDGDQVVDEKIVEITELSEDE